MSRTDPITATDDEIRAALEDAVLPPLLAALAHVTGDLSLLRDDLRIDPMLIAEPQGGMTPEQQQEARQLAFDVLVKFRDSGSPWPATPSEHDLVRMMEFATGTEVMREYVPLLEEELSITGEDLRAPRWHKRELAPELPYRIAVIGAGMSGLLAAYRLQQVGVEAVIIEKNPDVGGTWWENTYPGCRVDNPNHNYSYSFAQRHDWPMHYSTQDVLGRYFRNFAEEHGLLELVRFGTEVESVTWSDDDRNWTLRTRGPGGETTDIVADAVISATGQLNRPHLPEIDGVGTFAGPAFHSARWPQGLDLTGKRVAVIGTGASAAQFIPVIAEQVRELLVFQRTPAWFAPTPDYHDVVEDGLKWLYQHVPFYSEWNRFWIFWVMGDGQLAYVTADPDWEPKDRSVGLMNDELRKLLTGYLEEQFAGRPDLLEKVVPTYPPGSKRGLRDNGVWAGALTRDNVQLITTGIREITPTGIVGADGTEHEVDVIVYGTGFLASQFLSPMKVIGRGGRDLHEQWGRTARAYFGITVSGFPNLFLLYGPNTNIVINGSIVYFSECGVRYIMSCLGLALRHGGHALEIRDDVHDAFNHRLDEQNRRMAWGISTVNTWYKNADGHVTQNWPFTLLEYWERTREADPADYHFIGDPELLAPRGEPASGAVGDLTPVGRSRPGRTRWRGTVAAWLRSRRCSTAAASPGESSVWRSHSRSRSSAATAWCGSTPPSWATCSASCSWSSACCTATSCGSAGRRRRCSTGGGGTRSASGPGATSSPCRPSSSASSWLRGSSAAAVVLAVLLVARVVLAWDAFSADLTNHAKGFAFLTTVAASNVLGAGAAVIHGWWGLAWVLWWVGVALWPVLLYPTLIAVVIRQRKPGLETGINGTWFLLTVSTESVAVLAGLLLTRGENDALAFTALAAFTLGFVLYVIVMTLVFLRWTFSPLDPTEVDPPAWIAAGAVAITVLAGSNLLLAADGSARLTSVAPFLEGVVVLAWATATFWFPLMIAIGVWRHIVRRLPLRYHPSYWSLVFPLGMYGAATFRLRAAVELDALGWLPRVTLAVAFVAWLATAFGLVLEGGRALRRR